MRAAGRGNPVTANRRIIALAVLLGFLALPFLGLASGDSCCCPGASPCAPGAAPCTTLGATPCCDADRGAAGAVDPATFFAAPLADFDSAGWLLPFERSCGASPCSSAERSEATRALRLSVVLRI